MKRVAAIRTQHPPLLALLNGAVPPDLIAAGVLSGTKGEVLTLARAGAKYVDKADGSIALIASGHPAVSPLGLVIEPAIVNSATHSVGLADWTPTGLHSPTITLNFAAGPDGLTTASKLLVGDCSNSNESKVYQPFDATAQVYTFHFWAKAIDPGAQIVVGVQDPGGTEYSTKITPGASWQHFSFTTPALTAGTAYLLLGWLVGQGVHVASSSLIADLQVEPGAIAHSYVPNTTGAPVTCPADVVSFSPAILPVSRGAIEFDFTPRWTADGALRYLLYCESPNKGIGLASTSLTFTVDGADAVSGGTPGWVANVTKRIRIQWQPGRVQHLVNGVQTHDGATGTVTQMQSFHVGHAEGSFQCDGWIKNLRVTRH